MSLQESRVKGCWPKEGQPSPELSPAFLVLSVRRRKSYINFDTSEMSHNSGTHSLLPVFACLCGFGDEGMDIPLESFGIESQMSADVKSRDCWKRTPLRPSNETVNASV